MVRYNNDKNISRQDIITIKSSHKKMQDPQEDRRDHLDILFDLHTKYTSKIWSLSSRTCGSCVNQVKSWCESVIEKS
tara:strand:- start:8516 stop:8746 length:231 start_codon:yes stop_codon:yes gene_type:complete